MESVLQAISLQPAQMLFTDGDQTSSILSVLILSGFRTSPIFYFYGLDRIFYGCIDFFLILKMDFYGFLNGLWVFKIFKWMLSV